MSIQTDPTVHPVDLSGTYRIDPSHSRLGFVARHAMVTKVRGELSDFEGELRIDAGDPTRSTAEVRAAVASITTNDAGRDEHLRGADFFDAEQHPELTFRSTSAEQIGDDRFLLHGELSIRGVTRPVTLEIEHTGSARDPFGNLRVGFEGRTEVSRKEWGLTWNAPLETGGLLVGDRVRLELDVSAIKDGDES